MNRPTWDQIHMNQATLMATRSSCIKLQVGAVLVKDNRTISQGYNGVGMGCVHCCDYWFDFYTLDRLTENPEFASYGEFLKSPFFRTSHKSWSVDHELHAEQNAILWAAREGISTKDTSLYTIYSPCINCAKVIHVAGIIKVIYKFVYDSDKYGIDYLKKNNIICEQI